MPPRPLTFALLLCCAGALIAQAPRIAIEPPTKKRPLTLSGETPADTQTIVESSGDLTEWSPAFVSEEEQWTLLTGTDGQVGAHFYRLRNPPLSNFGEDPAWTHSLQLPGRADPATLPAFFNTDSEIYFAKFTIFLDDLLRVYFQDSASYLFHYEFAVDKLSPFAGMDREQFDRATLRRKGQVAIVGAVLVDPATKEYGIQFEGFDSYPPQWVAFMYKLVDSALAKTPDHRGFYMPSRHQRDSAEAASEWLAQQGINVSGTGRWTNTSNCYAPGWALGRLKFVPAEDVEDAFASGELTASDILLTDEVPAELPYLAGILSLAPATPNSHVALLAQSYGVPFLYLGNLQEVERTLDLVGQDVLVATTLSQVCGSGIIVAAEDAIAPEAQALLKDFKTADPIAIPAKTSFGAISADVATLTPGDIVHFGGKAANFGFLLREIPDNTRPFAVAFSFDLWDGYLDQEIEAGVSLRDWIASKLNHYTWPIADVAALKADLKAIRDKIDDEADFSPEQRIQILDALSGFDTDRPIRFRSSTNVEDSELFSGAGLYDSKTGCLADELDDDEDGPSQCDPGDPEEDGVFKSMRKVFASFYNDNAFMERLRVQVDEADAGMAILAHYSYPDEIEMANGVIVYRQWEKNWATVEVVSQPGAESVTNPEPGSVPEVASVYSSGQVYIQQQAALLRPGIPSVLEDNEYRQLRQQVEAVVEAYKQFHNIGDEEAFVLDFEYKKITPGRLEIKQVRRIPQKENRAQPIAFIGGPSRFSIYTAEANEVMTYHYLKSVMDVTFSPAYDLSSRFSDEPLIDSVKWTRVRNGKVETHTGDLLELFGASYSVEEGVGYYRWTENWDGEEITFELAHAFIPPPYDLRGPFIFGSETALELTVTFERPRFVEFDLGYPPGDELEAVYKKSFSTRFGPGAVETLPSDAVKVQFAGVYDDVTVEPAFYRPADPVGPTAGYTWLLLQWIETRISGLTSSPIILRNGFGQTQVQEHHNFGAHYVFEPRLDPGVPEALLEELEALDIMQIYLSQPLKFVGFDGEIRDAPSD